MKGSNGKPLLVDMKSDTLSAPPDDMMVRSIHKDFIATLKEAFKVSAEG